MAAANDQLTAAQPSKSTLSARASAESAENNSIGADSVLTLSTGTNVTPLSRADSVATQLWEAMRMTPPITHGGHSTLGSDFYDLEGDFEDGWSQVTTLEQALAMKQTVVETTELKLVAKQHQQQQPPLKSKIRQKQLQTMVLTEEDIKKDIRAKLALQAFLAGETIEEVDEEQLDQVLEEPDLEARSIVVQTHEPQKMDDLEDCMRKNKMRRVSFMDDVKEDDISRNSSNASVYERFKTIRYGREVA